MTKNVKHPVQPVVIANDGVYRFKENKIVSKLLEMATKGQRYSYNDIAIDYCNGKVNRDDMVQFAQLTGWSVSGFGGLSEVKDKDWERAQVKVEKMKKREGIK